MMKVMTIPGKEASWQFHVAETEEALGKLAFKYLLEELKRRPDLLLCASAGSTPTRAYQLLANRAALSPHLFSKLRILKIDEWGGLAMDHPATCEVYLQKLLVCPLKVDSGRYQGFDSQANDVRAECVRISRWLKSEGPIDVCVLGLGLNGHLALNEPAEHLEPQAHPSKLTKESLGHSMLRDSQQTPSCGLTLGMAEILQSRRILLLVSGEHKRQAFQRLLEPVLSTRFPGSFLWLHPDVTVICDQAVAGELLKR